MSWAGAEGKKVYVKAVSMMLGDSSFADLSLRVPFKVQNELPGGTIDTHTNGEMVFYKFDAKRLGFVPFVLPVFTSAARPFALVGLCSMP